MMLARLELQKISQAKLDDAELLFQHNRYSNSYYLFGFAAEIAIKSRLARVFSSDSIPDKRFVNDIYVHDLNKLVSLAGLKQELDQARNDNPRFDAHWSAVSDWSPERRYAMIDVFTATVIRNAMIDEDQGVFKWLRDRW